MSFIDDISSGKSVEVAAITALLAEFKGKSLYEKKELSLELFTKFYKDLKRTDRLNKDSVNELLEAIKNSLIKEEEKRLYKLLYESEKARKEIEHLGRDMRNAVFDSFKGIEDLIKESNSLESEALLPIINETLVGAAQLNGVIKEISESVFLSIIENGDDVKETSFEFSKNMVYKTLSEGEFKKYYAMEVAKTILEVTISVANESKIYTSELISGSIEGINAGILKAIDKFKESFKFAPEEISSEFNEASKEIAGIYEEYIALLKTLTQNSEDPAKTELENILKKDYDNYLAKMIRISSDATVNLKDSLSSMDISESYKEFSKFTSSKFDEIFKKGAKIWGDLELEEKMEAIKKDIADIDKNIRLKFSKKESIKELANRAFEVSKDKVKEKKGQAKEIQDSKESKNQSKNSKE
ncbi:MAG: hypothetical protein GXZ15_00335 [Campylobacter sp.]|nr:hypothetical protein [Campylobacter sp.]